LLTVSFHVCFQTACLHVWHTQHLTNLSVLCSSSPSTLQCVALSCKACDDAAAAAAIAANVGDRVRFVDRKVGITTGEIT
jgi:hypothetical protein